MAVEVKGRYFLIYSSITVDIYDFVGEKAACSFQFMYNQNSFFVAFQLAEDFDFCS